MSEKKVRVLIAEDHGTVREGMRLLIELSAPVLRRIKTVISVCRISKVVNAGKALTSRRRWGVASFTRA